jgi:sulfofructose kinase
VPVHVPTVRADRESLVNASQSVGENSETPITEGLGPCPQPRPAVHDGDMSDQRSLPLVSCAGIVTLDHIFRVDSLPTEEGKYSATGHIEVGGGVAANAAATVVQLGGAASFIGCVGDDRAGDDVLAQFAALGISTDSMQRVANRETPISFVLVDRDGHRELFNFVSPDFFERANPAFASGIDDADVVLVDCRWPLGSIHALEAARHRNIPAVVDVDRPIDADPDTATGRIMDLATHLVFSRDALLGTTNEQHLPTALAAAARRSAAWIAVTDGPNGVLWLDADEVRHQPAFQVHAVDTLGAGDVFHGAFALALAEGNAEPEAVRFASAAAAVKCTQPGGRGGIPDRSMVNVLLDSVAGATNAEEKQT